MIRALIYDFNGVLVDDEHVHFDLFREVLGQEGVAITERDYHEVYLGYDDRGCIERALLDAGQTAPRKRVDELIARKASRYAQVAELGLRIFPHAVENIRLMAKRWPIAICSGALRPEIEFVLKKMGVRELVQVIISAEDAERCKPDPDGYLLALDGLRSCEGEDLEAGHCLVVEDSRAGIQSAKSAGMWAIGLAQTYSPEDLRQAGSDAVIESLAVLTPEWIERFFMPEVSP
jgi:HAD superfamily hydrolase (TIGR01509 family)